MLYWIWNGKIILPLYKNKGRREATKLSLEYLFSNKANIDTIFNTKYVKNQTLFNMIKQNKKMTDKDKLQMLIDYGFNFEKLVNVYDNVRNENGLIQLSRYAPNYEEVKMLFDHCNSLKQCKIDITHCDLKKWHALLYAATSDSNTLKYLLSNFDQTNDDHMNAVQIALNQKDNGTGSTVAHNAAYNASPFMVDAFKLLHKYNLNFKIYNNHGRLAIHYACISNCVSLLSWMIDENVFDNDINCETRYARDPKDNGKTSLNFAVANNNSQCVDLLCKQTKNISITKNDIHCALKNDNVKILKLLFCGLFIKYEISSWNDIQQLKSSNIVSSKGIKDMILHCEKNTDYNNSACYKFLNDLLSKGYSCENFNYICVSLNYDLKTIINTNRTLTIATDDEYEIEKDLGQGTFGLVQLGKHKKTGVKVAIKHINIQKSKNNKSIPIQFITSEIESLKKLSTHSNIINLLNYIIFSDKVLLYFDYCSFGDLYSLLNQCDHFSLRISFKYFLQLLSSINTCHKLNIVHRDLKLKNILIDDTFQLKVADFGLASIVNSKNSKNETMYNVGTPKYRAPELLEHVQSNLKVLKACDVFSLSIIFWQMMNGAKYFPFTLLKVWDITESNYKYIKHGNYDKFWHIHKKCNMLAQDKKEDGQLLCNLFEKMFDYNPYQRITSEKILQHDWIVKKEENISFKLNDARLEVFVRDIYNTMKHSPVDQLTKESKPSSFKSTTITSTSMSVNVSTSSESSIKSSSDCISENAIDSSRISGYALQNRNLEVFKPIVIVVGIGNYKKNINDKDGVLADYINVKSMLNDVKKYDLIYQNKKHEIIHHKMQSENKLDDIKENKQTEATTQTHVFDMDNIDLNEEFQTEWTTKELKKFNQQVFKIIESREGPDKNYKYKYEYDGMIYIVSSHMKHDINTFDHSLYDSNGKMLLFNNIFDQFNNGKCVNLRKKPKIFVLDGYDPNDIKTETINIKNEDQKRMDQLLKISQTVNNDDMADIKFVQRHKRVLYCAYKNNNENITNYDINTDGNVLISSFCSSLANNEKKEMNLNDLIKQTQERYRIKVKHINNKIYDENYIENRYKVTFMATK